jgi:aldehyde dehydrogenase (NAD+)
MKKNNNNKILNSLKISTLEKDGCYPSSLLYHDSFYTTSKVHKLYSPVDGKKLANFAQASSKELDALVTKSQSAQKSMQGIPAPKRGEFVRQIGNIARKYKKELAYIITLESGKIYQEALGEVQEWIDVCDFAVGLSRQLYGLTIATERVEHRMMEQWHPLGVVGVISAFNFPMAVWAWNAMIAFVCGNSVIFKPSNRALFSALAIHFIINKALKKMPDIPKNISSIIIGSNEIGVAMAQHKNIALLSATGSVAMGKKLAPLVSSRLGKSLFELGGNSAMIVTPSANLELAVRAIVFSAVGTAGQRCTSLRRVIVHKSVKEVLLKKLIKAYKTLTIGNPFDKKTIVGPIVDKKAYTTMQQSIQQLKKEGGEILIGGTHLTKLSTKAFYVSPAIATLPKDAKILLKETFAPLLYIIEYKSLDEAISIQNGVSQGLSSSIFTQNVSEAELFLSAQGSDCGIANVNIGTSGAEIGGAFGGEKDTGGGRESGSDAWKAYMRRSTNTINYGKELPLSQGIKF